MSPELMTSERVLQKPQSPLSQEWRNAMDKNVGGKIRISAKSKSTRAIQLTVGGILLLTVIGFITFNYENVNFAEATAETMRNIGVLFGQPHLTRSTFGLTLLQLLSTLALGVLSTIFGAFIALFMSLLCAKNISNPAIANVVKSIVAFIRAVPTILWVLIFSVAAGLGSVAAVAGLTFHSVAYLVKAYSEAIEEMDGGTIEALRASGAGFWQIVFQAVLPSSITYMTAWTFLRFEINFTNAIAVGAAAGAGGIGFDLFMAGSFYVDLRELGFLTWIVVAAVILIEMAATKIKAKVR